MVCKHFLQTDRQKSVRVEEKQQRRAQRGLMRPILLIGSLLTSVPANAQLDVPVGTAFIYDDGRVERLVSLADDEATWSTRKGREFVRSHNFALPILNWKIGRREGTREIYGSADKLWPPVKGARASFRVRTDVLSKGRTNRSLQLWNCKVKKAQTIAIALGDFETLPIQCERFSNRTMNLLERRTWWYAPDIGHYVQRQVQNYRTGKRKTIKLCASLPPIRATKPRVDAVAETGCKPIEPAVMASTEGGKS